MQSSRSTNSREGRSGALRYGGLALRVVRGPGAGAEEAAAERLARRHQALPDTGEPTSVALVTPALSSLLDSVLDGRGCDTRPPEVVIGSYCTGMMYKKLRVH